MSFIKELKDNNFHNTKGKIYDAMRGFLLEFGNEVESYRANEQDCIEWESPDKRFLMEMSFDEAEPAFDEVSERKNTTAFRSRRGHIELIDREANTTLYSFTNADRQERDTLVEFKQDWFKPIYLHKKAAMEKSNDQAVAAPGM